MYVIGGYISLYVNSKNNIKKYICITILCYVFYLFFIMTMNLLGTKYAVFSQHATYMFGMNYLPTLIISISIFMCFKDIKFNYSEVINKISSLTFGIYLIHDNYLVRNLLWREIFNENYYGKSFFIFYTILCAILAYCSCALLEYLRKTIIEKNLLKLYNKIIINVGEIKWIKEKD